MNSFPTDVSVASSPKSKFYGGIVIAMIIIAFLIAALWGCGCYYTDKLPHKLKNHAERFRDSPNPLIYLRQLLSIPKYCKPYAGCNALQDTTNQNLTFCELSWRDCNAYEDCIHGKCIPKN